MGVGWKCERVDVRVCWGCIGGVFVATHSPDGWLVRGSVFILQRGDIRRFVIPWRCRVFHIAPHPWDHISSPHPQSPNRFIYRLSSCTYTPPSNTCIHTGTDTYSCIYTINSRRVQALRTTNTTHLKSNVCTHDTLTRKYVHTDLLFFFFTSVMQCSLSVSNKAIQQYCNVTILFRSTASSWWGYNCSHIFHKAEGPVQPEKRQYEAPNK